MSERLDGAAGPSQRFASNALWLLISQAAGKLASFIFVIIVARGLGVHEYGYFNFAVSFVPIFLVIGSLGLDLVVIREVARNRENLSKVFASGLALRLPLAFGGLLLAALSAPLLAESPKQVVVVAIVGLALFIDELTAFVGAVFKAFERMAFYGGVVLANRVGSTILALLVVTAGGDIVALSVTYLAGSLGALAIAGFALRRHFPPIRLRDVQASVVRMLFRSGLPLTAAAALNSMLFRADAIMLQWLKDPVAVGLYGAAYRFFESFLFVAWSLTDVAWPRMTRQERSDESNRTFEFTVTLMLCFYLPLAVISLFGSTWLVTTLFSNAYRSAGGAVPWLTGAALLYSVAYLCRVAVITFGRRREIVWIAGLALTTNVVANLIAIPRYGFKGAAAVTFFTEILEVTLLLGLFFRSNPDFRFTRVSAVPFTAAGATLAVLLATRSRAGTSILVGAVTYLVALPLSALLLAPEQSRQSLRRLRRRGQPSGSPGE